MFKKLISATLSLTMLISAAAADGFNSLIADNSSNNGHNATDITQGQYDIKASNSLGNFIKQSSRENDLNPEVSKLSNNLNGKYAVTNLGFDAESGILTAASSQPEICTIVFSFIDEETNESVQEVKTEVKAGESIITEAKADISNLPQYYLVQAQLVDKNGKALSNAFKLNTYTRIIQEIAETDIHDFNEEQVVNFDESEDTNFIVLSEDTVMAESSESENTLVSADYENNTFVIDNIDESVENLQSGEYFYMQPNDEDIIAIAVEDIQIDGDTATLKGSSEIDDMFDFVKFESVTDMENCTVNTAAAEGKFEFPEHEDEEEFVLENNEPLRFVNTPKFGMKFNHEYELGLSLDKFKSEAERKMEGDEHISFNGSINFKTTINFYKKWSYMSLGFTIGFEVKASINITTDNADGEKQSKVLKELSMKEGKLKDITTDLISISIPTCIPGVVISVVPKIVFEYKGEINIEVIYAPVFGFKYDTDLDFQDLSQHGVDCVDAKLEMKGELFFGLRISPGLSIISPKIADASFDITAGVVISIGAEVSIKERIAQLTSEVSSSGKVAIVDTDEEMYHSCALCFEGSIAFRVEFGFSFSAFDKLIASKKAATLDSPIKALDFYVSFPNGGGLPRFGRRRAYYKFEDERTCPYRKFRVKFRAWDTEAKAPIPGAEVILDGLSQFTDGNGYATFYCDKGSYSYTTKYGNKTVMTESFEVSNGPKFVSINTQISVDDTGNVKIGNTSSESSSNETNTTIAETTRTTVTTTKSQVVNNDEEEIIEVKQLGDNVVGMIYPDGLMYIYGYGDMASDLRLPPHQPISFTNIKTVKTVIIDDYDPDEGKFITSIGSYLFNQAENLETVYLSNEITKIGDFAFGNCTNLKYFRYGGEEDTSETFVLPSKLEHIGAGAFNECTSVSFGNLVIPEGVTYIGHSSFFGCPGIHSVKSVNKDTIIGGMAFGSCKNLEVAEFRNVNGEYLNFDSSEDKYPATVTNCPSLKKLILPFIGRTKFIDDKDHSNGQFVYLFNSSKIEDRDKYYYNGHCVPSALKSITILDGTIIPSSAFSKFSELEEIKLPKTITYIGSAAFWECTNARIEFEGGFNNVLKNEGFTSIPGSAFLNCSNTDFGDLVIPENISTIDSYAFKNCNGITSLKVEGEKAKIGVEAFEGCTKMISAEFCNKYGSFSDGILGYCISLENLTLPFAGASLEQTEANKYSSHSPRRLFISARKIDDNIYNIHTTGGVPKSLKSITITGGTVIPQSAFYQMWSLTEINLPDSITEIGSSAFQSCSGLKEITLPSSLEIIDNSAFSDCSGLEKVYFHDGIKLIDTSAFKGCGGNDNKVDEVNYEGSEEQWAEIQEKYIMENNEPIKNGKVNFNVLEFIYGDVNDDGKISKADGMLLARYLAGWEGIVINIEAADINRDGQLSKSDGMILSRYIAGWEGYDKYFN